MRRLRQWALLGAIAGLAGVLAAFDGPWSTLPSPGSTPQVGVYLFVWYQPAGTGWGNGASHVPAGGPRPTLGWYDSAQPEVLRAHLNGIADAGFDFAIVNLVADDPSTWDVVARLYREASTSHLRLAVMLDGLYREPPAVQRAWLERARDEFGNHPNAFRLGGQPLVLLFSSFAPVTAEGVVVRNAYWSPDYRNGVNPFYRERSPSSPTYPIDWPFWAPGLPPMLNGVVPLIPGYDDRHLMRERSIYYPRDDGRLYAVQWEHALRLKPDIITVYSWNEHFEGTAIEPTDVWGNQYVDLTRRYVEQARGGR